MTFTHKVCKSMIPHFLNNKQAKVKYTKVLLQENVVNRRQKLETGKRVSSPNCN